MKPPDYDIVARLRFEADNDLDKGLPPFDGWYWLHHAADEIERLRALVKGACDSLDQPKRAADPDAAAACRG